MIFSVGCEHKEQGSPGFEPVTEKPGVWHFGHKELTVIASFWVSISKDFMRVGLRMARISVSTEQFP